jgi:hypothetical protein
MKTITVLSAGDLPVQIHLSYSIKVIENVHTISCIVDEKHFPIWLQLRKFDMLSLKQKNGFLPLFNEVNDSRNMATSLFIDTVYTKIMHAEKMRVLAVPVN